MNTFYISYGLGSNLAKNFSKVLAPDYGQARSLVDDVTQGKFAFMYDNYQWNNMNQRCGLTEVALQPQILENP